jgi:RNA polymerase sigma-70 factor (sigma-E family)
MRVEQDEAFHEFVSGRWAAIVRLAYALTGDLGHAEDVAQAAFTKAYASWARVLRAGDPDAYVRRIVINENLNRFRRHRVPERLSPDLPTAALPDSTGLVDDRTALIAALQRLAPRARAVIVLRYWLDMSEQETAAALNCSVGTVKSQASRALATLRSSAELAEGDIR